MTRFLEVWNEEEKAAIKNNTRLTVAIELAIKKWLDQERPKSVESMDEIIANDFITYLVSQLNCVDSSRSDSK